MTHGREGMVEAAVALIRTRHPVSSQGDTSIRKYINSSPFREGMLLILACKY